MDDGGVRALNDIKYILELRENLISLDTLQASGFSYTSYGDKDTMKVSKDALTVMEARRTTGTSTNY